MPNRVIRGGINSSLRVDRLSLGAELFYRRLLLAVDDYGRFDADPRLLRAALYPLRIDTVTNAEVEAWLNECVTVTLVERYEHNGTPLLHLTPWHNKPRASKSRYPEPQTSARTCAQMRADENMCAQMRADAPVTVTVTETETEYVTETNTPSISESTGAAASAAECVEATPDKSQRFTDSQAATIYEAYPRHEGRGVAIRKIKTALKAIAARGEADAYGWLLARVQAYAVARRGQDANYTPHCATWINQGRFDDDDAEWNRTIGQGRPVRVEAKPGKYAHLLSPGVRETDDGGVHPA